MVCHLRSAMPMPSWVMVQKPSRSLRELDELAKQRYVSPANRAAVYFGLGKNEKALDWLEKAYEDRDPIFWWINGDQLYRQSARDPALRSASPEG